MLGYPIVVEALDADHFWGFVDRDVEGAGGHWLWKGRRGTEGDGMYVVWDPARCRPRRYRAHRVAYALAHGGLAGGSNVLHRPGCAERLCVRPEHLCAGDVFVSAIHREPPERRPVVAVPRSRPAVQLALPGLDMPGKRPARSGGDPLPHSPTGATEHAGVRVVDVRDLVSSREIGERLNLGHVHQVHSWRARYPDFPAPVARLAIGLVWSWPDIEAWASANRRRGRRSG